MNRDRRWGTSAVRVRLLIAGVVVLAAGAMLLGSSRSRTHRASALLQPTVAASPLAPSPAKVDADHVQHGRSLFASLPMIFEPNQGQAGLNPADTRAQFIARGPGYGLFLGSDGAILTLQSKRSQSGESKSHRIDSLHMKLAGANPNAVLSAADPLPGKSNYLIGNDSSQWRQGIPQFARVRYQDVYPGINLVFYGTQNQLEYDFQVAPGSDPSKAELEFSGAKHIALQGGDLIIAAENGAVRLNAPRIYQEVDGRQQPVTGSFVLRASNRVGFSVGAYDHSRELVIDPILHYATYFGGSGDELHNYVAVDNVGNIYLAGSTTSVGLPTGPSGIVQSGLNGAQNVYLAKLNPSAAGTAQLVYLTYLGGSGSDYPAGISVDTAANPYLAGTTSSSNFPTTQTGYQTSPASANTHVFVTRLNNTATALSYSSYLSGNGTDISTGMTSDANGNLYVTGTTTSVESSLTDQFPATNLPQPLPYQTFSKAPGLPQFFVTKVNTVAQRTGSIAYSTYFGGGDFTPEAPATGPTVIGGGIAVDGNGNIYFTGTTNYTYSGTSSTTDFPILNAYQPCLDQTPPTQVINPPTCSTTTVPAQSDAFVAKLNPNGAQGQQLQWSTYVGGSQDDFGTAVAVNTGATNVYITGTTNSPDVTGLTTFASYQKCLGNVYTGTGTAITCQTPPANTDAFVAVLSNPATSSTTNVQLTYFSYLGGSGNEKGLGIAVDNANGAVITGWTNSTSSASSGTPPTTSGSFPVFPYPNAVQSQLSGAQDAFLARLNTVTQTGQTNGNYANYYGVSGTGEGTSVALDSSQNVYLAGDTNGAIATDNPYQLQNNGGSDAFAVEFSTASQLAVTGILTLGANQTFITAGNQATFTYTIQNNGPDPATNIQFLDTLSGTGVAMTANSISASGGTCSTASGSTTSLSCSIPSLQSGSTATVTVVLTPTPQSGNACPPSAQFNGGAITVNAANAASVQTSVAGSMSDFCITAGPNAVTVLAGQTAVYQVQLTPSPVYGSSISLSATGLPTAAAASFSTSPVSMPSQSPAATVLSISTTARPITTPIGSLFHRTYYAFWLVVPGVAVFGFGKNQHRRRVLSMLALCVLGVLIGLQPACSKQNITPPVSGTPAGSYPISIAATSGTDTKNYTVTLIVQ